MAQKEIMVMRSALEQFRAEKDEFFHFDSNSPLTPEQRKNFKPLDYYPDNPEMVLTVQLDLFPGQETIEMQTTGGEPQVYTRYGRFRFKVEGQEAELTIFASEDGGFFLPFVDASAGVETYGAGRYLEPEPVSANVFEIDFNLAYNPYCAYNENWSCPLTPFENRLKVAVRAGEKVYHEQKE